ncbi:MAG: bifunctional (p)ppGpp synthetase/guanosine-3',5'-bis(diphosphate) 3'-pyrophosphohydrolase [Deltaproteobacteria bacterium]|nr:bifunctional (p)ppGpp synthetase/guanosine-3',5'-bis(diphosphate) 3'-pyrophosphohydrolase [Deltaproteobacteria bacterium]
MAATRRYEEIAEALSSYLPSPDLDLVQKAYLYSAKVHAGQVRKSGEAYLIHPLEVAWLLTELRLDEASVVTGLLHDTIEDTLTSMDDIRDMFGAEVALMVDGVTKLSEIRFDTDEHKQAENFRKMLVAMAKDIRVILVKLADRLHNMRTLHHLPDRKRVRIAQETVDIYAPLANRLGIHWVKSELEDLSFQYLQPEDFADLKGRVDRLTEERHAYVENVVDVIKAEMTKRELSVDVSGRPKHLFSIFKKMSQQQIEFEQVYDVIAFRVLVDTVGQCYEVLGHVHSLWHPIPGRFKDYIAMPKPNQYQSLHTSVIGPEGERIEIQIRTREMQKICEEGVAAHWDYKEGANLSEGNKNQFAWLRQLMEWQQDLKDPNEFLDTVKYDLFTDEVFVFTPRGEVISLKRGSTPVDFAFAIHTEVGSKCAGAKINGRMVPLRHELKNGDMVEVITNSNQRPNRDWLKFVASGRARQKIRTIIRSDERERSRELGRDILERELKRNNFSLNKLLKDGRMQAIVERSKHRDVEGLYVAIGYGNTTPAQIISKLDPQTPPKEAEPTPLSTIFKKVARRSNSGIVVSGIEDVLVRFAKCCNPLPGDSILGFVTRGRGITVHLNTCSRAIDMDPERQMDVSWDDGASIARPVTVRVTTEDRAGLLAEISQIFTNASVNISEANCKVVGEDRAVNTFEVLIRDKEQLRSVVGKIKGLRGIVSVDRV